MVGFEVFISLAKWLYMYMGWSHYAVVISTPSDHEERSYGRLKCFQISKISEIPIFFPKVQKNDFCFENMFWGTFEEKNRDLGFSGFFENFKNFNMSELRSSSSGGVEMTTA